MKLIFFERLPVGHTHEDIDDAVFSRIWTRMRDVGVITPQDYRRLVTSALTPTSERTTTMKFTDIYCVPDYKGFMEVHIDSKFSRAFKEQWTQLCFRFRSVERCDNFPTGVEMHYRAYAQDTVYQIVDSELWACGKGDRKCVVQWQPEGMGMYLIRSLPSGSVPPAKSIAGFRPVIEKQRKSYMVQFCF